jgi:hypothetical protein
MGEARCGRKRLQTGGPLGETCHESRFGKPSHGRERAKDCLKRRAGLVSKSAQLQVVRTTMLVVVVLTTGMAFSCAMRASLAVPM